MTVACCDMNALWTYKTEAVKDLFSFKTFQEKNWTFTYQFINKQQNTKEGSRCKCHNMSDFWHSLEFSWGAFQFAKFQKFSENLVTKSWVTSYIFALVSINKMINWVNRVRTCLCLPQNPGNEVSVCFHSKSNPAWNTYIPKYLTCIMFQIQLKYNNHLSVSRSYNRQTMCSLLGLVVLNVFYRKKKWTCMCILWVAFEMFWLTLLFRVSIVQLGSELINYFGSKLFYVIPKWFCMRDFELNKCIIQFTVIIFEFTNISLGKSEDWKRKNKWPKEQ